MPVLKVVGLLQSKTVPVGKASNLTLDIVRNYKECKREESVKEKRLDGQVGRLKPNINDHMLYQVDGREVSLLTQNHLKVY